MQCTMKASIISRSRNERWLILYCSSFLISFHSREINLNRFFFFLFWILIGGDRSAFNTIATGILFVKSCYCFQFIILRYHSFLSGMNLQICFMNETPSDTESPCSETDSSPGSTPTSLNSKQPQKQQMPIRPQVLSLPPLRLDTGSNSAPIDEADFFARQARLQTEARMALAQAKEMAHMQMEVERQRLKQSPITEMVRSSLEKVSRTSFILL